MYVQFSSAKSWPEPSDDDDDGGNDGDDDFVDKRWGRGVMGRLRDKHLDWITCCISMWMMMIILASKLVLKTSTNIAKLLTPL